MYSLLIGENANILLRPTSYLKGNRCAALKLDSFFFSPLRP
jgi:hypothetical protein